MFSTYSEITGDDFSHDRVVFCSHIFIQFFISIDKKIFCFVEFALFFCFLLTANSNKVQKFIVPTFNLFCEFENGIVIALVRSLCPFIFYETCFWSALQIPIQRRRCIVHLHAFSCFNCDHAYLSAITVCPAMFNVVKVVDILMHVSPAQDFFSLFALLHLTLVLLLFNRIWFVQ